MFNSNTDKEWEKFGRDDPYYGVLNHKKYLTENLTSENKEEFFQAGTGYIDHVFANIRKHIDPAFTVHQALDFGCGVGRLTVPLAKLAQEVTGADVSDSMLSEARKNCESQSIVNANFIKSDDHLSSITGQYNFILSHIVFQHIPTERGEQIFQALLQRLDENGVGVVHFTYAKQRVPNTTIASLIRKYLPYGSNFLNLTRGKKFFAPQMQMNSYDVNRLFSMIQKARVIDFYTEFTDHGGEFGIVIYFKKPQAAQI
ncbi:class I SAM-dependent methyltransferase [Variovorax sp. PCZ-1]|uniref:class I SAM-dependent methyltransferase n=1 Tax=Variovorax sp. PCZ-1 TaxID=2835533 RepID=UPI001BCBECE0|nr:class I SAM-dependent methyltransferase [Variovorax sp. PCZ-1]MBS7807928.1 class I SAM-dependent methyltransferase [Variovorax sp. PCZ-1]